MKRFKTILITSILLLVSHVSYPQDNRTTETKVADLLARFPANDLQFNNKLMGDMQSLGAAGQKMICDQIVSAGTGDDTRARFAIESFTRFVSQKGHETEKAAWEKTCINYALDKKDNGVKDFFMKQLQLIGGDASVEAMKIYLPSSEMCEPSLAVILAAGGKNAESVLAESLKNKDLTCAASVMNALAKMNSKIAANEYILWSKVLDINTKASANNALAMSGSPLAYQVLSDAAKGVEYRWEHTGATAALLNYANIVGKNGDIKTADKICKLVISKCNDNATIQNKTAALSIYVGLHGIDAMPMLLKAAAHQNSKYRTTSMGISLNIPGTDVVNNWINYFPKAIPEAKPEIISMLGERGDDLALSLVTTSLSAEDLNTRREASAAIVKISGNQSLNSLINYLLVFGGEADQEAAKTAIMSVAGSDNLAMLIPVLNEGPVAAKKSAIEILAWSKDSKYFSSVFPLTSSSDEKVKSAAIKALPSLAAASHQTKLIELLSATEKPEYISDIQSAIAAAAAKIENPETRSDYILESLEKGENIDPLKATALKIKLLPILAKTGGSKALTLVNKEFENGNAEVRDVCFKTLTAWRDYSASSVLYEICASRNKTYEAPAFDGYMNHIRNTYLPDEQKLLLFRKIMPFAVTAERKSSVLTEIGKLKTYQSLYFVADYLDDPEASAAAAKAVMYIALPSVTSKAEMYGDIAKEILLKAIDKLTGMESEYDMEMVNKYLAGMPADEGFKPMFNGKDLTGWQGLVENPVARAKMKPAELAKKQIEADKKVQGNWSVKDGCIWFNGTGENLCSIKEYGDSEMMVDWKISKAGDSGIYLRGSPQVQIWDISRVEAGAQVGSGGLYNNQKNPSKPLKVADNPVGDWNTFRIVMIGEKVSVWLNGEIVVDNVTLENYWDRNIPIFPKGAIELQAHGNELAFRDIYVREISEKEFNLTPEERQRNH